MHNKEEERMKNISKVFRKAAASFLAAAVCVTSLPVSALGGTPAERTDDTIVYFVDCGDWTVNTVDEGDQLGTHNSVTDQVYGEDPVTGYSWGIDDTVSDPLTNGTSGTGGADTDWSWPMENSGAAADVAKTVSNRYTKNQFEKGVEERYLAIFSLCH